jgi:hypothetical protein
MEVSFNAKTFRTLLHGAVAEHIEALTADEIRRDVEQSNPMRPWRIINLNYGIVATRSIKVAGTRGEGRGTR